MKGWNTGRHALAAQAGRAAAKGKEAALVLGQHHRAGDDVLDIVEREMAEDIGPAALVVEGGARAFSQLARQVTGLTASGLPFAASRSAAISAMPGRISPSDASRQLVQTKIVTSAGPAVAGSSGRWSLIGQPRSRRGRKSGRGAEGRNPSAVIENFLRSTPPGEAKLIGRQVSWLAGRRHLPAFPGYRWPDFPVA